jgi:hypothetical protein
VLDSFPDAFAALDIPVTLHRQCRIETGATQRAPIRNTVSGYLRFMPGRAPPAFSGCLSDSLNDTVYRCREGGLSSRNNGFMKRGPPPGGQLAASAQKILRCTKFVERYSKQTGPNSSFTP